MPAIDKAEEFVHRILGNGPVAAARVFFTANCLGICNKTLKTAKKNLRVRSCRKAGAWFWVRDADQTFCRPQSLPSTTRWAAANAEAALEIRRASEQSPEPDRASA